MNATLDFALLDNAASLPWADVPEWPMPEFVHKTAAELDRGGRLCAWFGVPEGAATRLVAVVAFDADNTLAVARSAIIAPPIGVPFTVRNGYPALTATHPQAHLFEREIWEQHALMPIGHPWLKPVRKTLGGAPALDDFFRVDGREIHEVAVGPVHAGIIEPGHFRFQCAGEEVIHLEIGLGYQHRGIEHALIGGPHPDTMSQMEAIAGDMTIGHATAHASVMEALAGAEPPLRAQWLRAIALELERLANHTGDLGALANDVAFLPTASACGKIRGDFLNLTALLCGNRFGRGLVRPGGCRHDLEPARLEQMTDRLATAMGEVERASAWLWDAASVRARFENVGTVFAKQAADLGLVGPAARACGLVRDVRYDHPAGWYRFAQAPVAVWPSGDVFGRARVRWLEVQRSGQLLREQLAGPPEGEIRGDPGTPAPDMLAVALVEGWRGEVCHVALTGPAGTIRRYKVVDPSFHNWIGLALAMRGQAVSDFPLCNKSFNLSYCGFDL
jgi:Ni,Fe-hydrogenase III large subunit